MNWDSTYSEDSLRIAEGTLSMLLLMCTFVAVIVDFFHYAITEGEYSNQAFAFVLATLLHFFGVLLLFDLTYGRDKDSKHQSHRPPPLSTLNVMIDSMPAISDVTTQSEDFDDSDIPRGTKEVRDTHKKSQKESESSQYVSMASISTTVGESGSYDDALDHAATLECAFGFSFPLAHFCISSFLLSSMLLLASLSQQITSKHFLIDNSSSAWIKAAYLISYGFFFSCASLTYYKIIAESCDTPLLQNRWLKLGLSGGFAFITIGFLAEAWSSRNILMRQLAPFRSSQLQQKSFWGEAWATGAYIIDEDEYCQNVNDEITVNLTVVYGGDWACPSNPSQWCEVPITTKVECAYFEYAVQEDDENDGETEKFAPQDYVYFRYHDYGVDDDEAYNYEEEPSFHSWNRPAEDIIASCSSPCSAQPEAWMWSMNQRTTQSTYVMHLCLGASICFLGWPLFELFTLVRPGSAM
jgi:hypothetical protein